MSWTEKTRGLRTCHRLLLDLTSGEIQAHREGEAPAGPQERKTLSKKAQQELRPPEGLATKQFFCNAGVNRIVAKVDFELPTESPYSVDLDRRFI